MLAKDVENENDSRISMVEYLASFWNAEAVQKIRAARDSEDSHTFADDKTFEDILESGSFKDNPDVDSLRKNTNLKPSNDRGSSSGRDTRLPRDLSSIKGVIDSE